MTKQCTSKKCYLGELVFGQGRLHDTEILCNVVNLFLLCLHSCIIFVFVVSPQPDDVVNVAVDKVNGLLESFMGINDTELGKTPTQWHYTTPRVPTDHIILRSIMKIPHGSYYCYTLYKCKSKDHKWRNALQMKKKCYWTEFYFTLSCEHFKCLSMQIRRIAPPWFIYSWNILKT